jgi:hypothetical protein
MVEEALVRLKRKFKDNVEWELKGQEQIGEEQAQRLTFQGEVNNDIYTGQCYMVAHKGVGHWIFTWTPGTIDELNKNPGLKSELADLPKGLTLRDRIGWKGDHPTRHLLTSPRWDYTLDDTYGIWRERKADDFDADADLALQAQDQELAIAVRTAEVVVFVVKSPEDGNVLEAAQDWLAAYHKRPPYDNTKSEPIPTKSGTRLWADHVGDAKGYVLKYHVTNTDSRERLVVVGVVPRGDRYLLIHGECDWRYRSLWELDFVQLIDSYRSKKS